MKKIRIVLFLLIAPVAVSSALAGTGIIIPLEPPDSIIITPSDTVYEIDGFFLEEDTGRRSFEWHSRISHEQHGVSGAGSGSSFLDSGGHTVGEVEFRSYSPVGENWSGELNTTFQVTQSRRYDPSDFSVRQIRYILSDSSGRNHLTLGDYYASLSQYSMNRSLKGLGYQRNFREGWYMRIAGGVFHPRWDHVAGLGKNRPVDRRAVGLRAQAAGERSILGVNVLTAWDWDRDPERTTQTTYSQMLYSLDWEHRVSGIILSGEHAYAPTRRQPAGGSDEDITGSANRINTRAHAGNLRFQFRGEHVTPDFYTMAGGAAVDRFRIYARGDYRIDSNWSVYAGNDWYRNNLKDRLTSTTRTLIPEIGLRARGLFDRRSLLFTSGIRRRVIRTEKPVGRESISDRLNLSLGDRYRALSLRGETEIMLNNRRKPSPGTKTRDYLYRLVADSRHLFLSGSLEMRPYITLSHQEIEDSLTGKPVRINSLDFDLRGTAVNNLSFGLSYGNRRNRSSIPGQDNSREVRYSANAERSMEFLGGARIQADFGQSRYRFSDSERNYRENFFQLSFNRSF